nr:NAD-dependent epimerase/dehydratase family protein [bacterium]
MSQIERVLVIGAAGQIGSELVPALREKYGPDNVVATDLNAPSAADGSALALDITDREALDRALHEHRIDTVVNLAALLSATGEKIP